MSASVGTMLKSMANTTGLPTRGAYSRVRSRSLWRIARQVMLPNENPQPGPKSTEARNYYQKVLDRHKDDLSTLMALYNLELVAKRPDEAKKVLERAVSKHPTAVQPVALMAASLLEAGAPLKTIEVTEAAVAALRIADRLR
jgi:uncharacterized protein HemY